MEGNAVMVCFPNISVQNQTTQTFSCNDIRLSDDECKSIIDSPQGITKLCDSGSEELQWHFSDSRIWLTHLA